MGQINQKGTRMVKDGEDSFRLQNDELEKFRLNFSRSTNRDVAPLSVIEINYLLTSISQYAMYPGLTHELVHQTFSCHDRSNADFFRIL